MGNSFVPSDTWISWFPRQSWSTKSAFSVPLSCISTRRLRVWPMAPQMTLWSCLYSITMLLPLSTGPAIFPYTLRYAVSTLFAFGQPPSTKLSTAEPLLHTSCVRPTSMHLPPSAAETRSTATNVTHKKRLGFPWAVCFTLFAMQSTFKRCGIQFFQEKFIHHISIHMSYVRIFFFLPAFTSTDTIVLSEFSSKFSIYTVCQASMSIYKSWSGIYPPNCLRSPLNCIQHLPLTI